MRKRFLSAHWKRWKHKPEHKNVALEKMQIPLPIPHPVCIAIEIYNRDSDDPIPLDSDICWEILKAIEEANGEIQVSTYIICIPEVIALCRERQIIINCSVFSRCSSDLSLGYTSL